MASPKNGRRKILGGEVNSAVRSNQKGAHCKIENVWFGESGWRKTVFFGWGDAAKQSYGKFHLTTEEGFWPEEMKKLGQRLSSEIEGGGKRRRNRRAPLPSAVTQYCPSAESNSKFGRNRCDQQVGEGGGEKAGKRAKKSRIKKKRRGTDAIGGFQ